MKPEKTEDVCQPSVYEKLFLSIAPQLRNYLLYKFQNSKFAEDSVQDAFYVLWQNCRDVTRDLAKAYVFRVAQNKIIKRLEKEKVHRKYLDLQLRSEEEVGPDFHLEYSELSKKLKRAIEQLPDGQREVFLLNRLEHKTYKEIAALLEVSVKAVEKRMHKALLKLRLICKEI